MRKPPIMIGVRPSSRARRRRRCTGAAVTVPPPRGRARDGAGLRGYLDEGGAGSQGAGPQRSREQPRDRQVGRGPMPNRRRTTEPGAHKRGAARRRPTSGRRSQGVTLGSGSAVDTTPLGARGPGAASRRIIGGHHPRQVLAPVTSRRVSVMRYAPGGRRFCARYVKDRAGHP